MLYGKHLWKPTQQIQTPDKKFQYCHVDHIVPCWRWYSIVTLEVGRIASSPGKSPVPSTACLDSDVNNTKYLSWRCYREITATSVILFDMNSPIGRRVLLCMFRVVEKTGYWKGVRIAQPPKYRITMNDRDYTKFFIVGEAKGIQ